ncbi:helix-turn-helix domain-containing protein [Companilactobacillus kedongensis]|uniref:helix-turn-helix domain-containing protein n=1 Tax=Companilactobacillus kedongensis TaxID=2486004 RepID=UPI000F77D6D6|nr:helix-turn-helix transcriptional regulator [Companilactobacillus kedongensis]
MLLGQTIQNKRKSLNLSQEELADGICTQAVISKIENQNTPPSINFLIAICQKLHLTLDQVFSEFSSLPSSNMTQDKFQILDNAVQDDDYKTIEAEILTIKESTLPSREKAHLHFLFAKLAESKKDFDEAIFQLNYSLESLTNRSVFWGTMIYAELGSIYLAKSQLDKTNYYLDLAFSGIDIVVNSSSEYFYYRSMIILLAKQYSKNKNYERSDQLIAAGLHKFSKYFTAKFTDELYYLSAVNILSQTPIGYNKLSHALTAAIAFADYNDNNKLLDQIKNLMSSHNINELKIKP